jgi:hypothetical protein
MGLSKRPSTGSRPGSWADGGRYGWAPGDDAVIRHRVKKDGTKVLVIDLRFQRSDGTDERYRKDAQVQTKAAAQAEERRLIAQFAEHDAEAQEGAGHEAGEQEKLGRRGSVLQSERSSAKRSPAFGAGTTLRSTVPDLKPFEESSSLRSLNGASWSRGTPRWPRIRFQNPRDAT